MTWRDEDFDADANLLIVGPLAVSKIVRLPALVRRWVCSSGSAPFRHRRDIGGEWRRVPARTLDAAADDVLWMLAPGEGTARLEEIARARRFDAFAVTVTVSAPYVALSFSHRYSDGVVALAAARALLSGAEPPASRVSRFPLLRALLRSGDVRPRIALAARRRLHADALCWERAPRVTAHPRRRVEVRLAPDGVARASDAHRDAGGRKAPASAVVASAVLRAVRAVTPPGTSLPVRMHLGLRRHLGPGWTTPGNFASFPTMASLDDHDWTPGDFQRVSAARIAEGAVAELAWESLSRWRGRLRGREQERGQSPRPVGLSLNMLTGGVGLEPGDYDGAPEPPSLIMVSATGVLGPFLTISATGRDFRVTAVDDSGLLDLEAFPQAIDDALAALAADANASSR